MHRDRVPGNICSLHATSRSWGVYAHDGDAKSERVLILGGGFNGLRLAFLLHRQGYRVEIVERESRLGGMVQTFTHTWNGGEFHFDYGPHLFFDDYLAEYRELLGDELLRIRDRFAMVTQGVMLSYPLRPLEMFTRMNPLRSAGYLLDFGLTKLKGSGAAAGQPNLKTVMTERFGPKLFEDFYAPYIEKCCGLPSELISPLWARERENVSGKNPVDNIVKKVQSWFSRAVRERLSRANHPSASEILAWYPRRGAGQVCDAMAATLPAAGLHLGAAVTGVQTAGGRVQGVVIEQAGKSRTLQADLYIATIPLQQLVRTLSPPAPPALLAAADRLKYRTVRLVNLIVGQDRILDCLEIFSMTRTHPFKRVYEPKAMSAWMSPPGLSSLCMEVCCSEGEEFHTLPAAQLAERCVDALLEMKLLAARELVKEAFVVDLPHAYPVYPVGFEQDQQALLGHLAGCANLLTSGRQGLFRYHAMTNEVMEMADSVVRFLAGDREKRARTTAVRSGASRSTESPMIIRDSVVRDMAKLVAWYPLRWSVAASPWRLAYFFGEAVGWADCAHFRPPPGPHRPQPAGRVRQPDDGGRGPVGRPAQHPAPLHRAHGVLQVRHADPGQPRPPHPVRGSRASRSRAEIGPGGDPGAHALRLQAVPAGGARDHGPRRQPDRLPR